MENRIQLNLKTAIMDHRPLLLPAPTQDQPTEQQIIGAVMPGSEYKEDTEYLFQKGPTSRLQQGQVPPLRLVRSSPVAIRKLEHRTFFLAAKAKNMIYGNTLGEGKGVRKTDLDPKNSYPKFAAPTESEQALLREFLRRQRIGLTTPVMVCGRLDEHGKADVSKEDGGFRVVATASIPEGGVVLNYAGTLVVTDHLVADQNSENDSSFRVIIVSSRCVICLCLST